MAGSFLSRESTVAPPDYPRVLVPPAALAVHLSIGQAYAFSVFNLPLTKLIGIDHSAPGDWNIKEVVWTFSIAIAILGLAAAVFGRWVERVGPRKSMFVSALCFGGGFIVAALGVHYHMLLLIYLAMACSAAAASASATSRRCRRSSNGSRTGRASPRGSPSWGSAAEH